MRIEVTKIEKRFKPFSQIKQGDVFEWSYTGDKPWLYMKTIKISTVDYVGNAINMRDGSLCAFNDYDKVDPKPDAKIVFSEEE